jgi:REP element-mobilizing transposase RayT
MVTATVNRGGGRVRQLSLDGSMFRDAPKEFGGASLKNSHPKTARPVTTKKAMHVVLRSRIANNAWVLAGNQDIKARNCKGKDSFISAYKRRMRIECIIREQADHFGIRIYQLAVNQNHIHVLLKLQYIGSFSKFVKAISSCIARLVLGVKKGVMRGIRFWDGRPFSRIVEWARDYLNAREYVFRNDLEGCGVIPYSPRRKSKKKYRYRYQKEALPVFG